ncbi:arginine repressor [Pseudonocardia charpentierae]|uniref:DUF222 domain-containing protein n=1 Tax=Pseudonocardia charpentierae TaxID=3075545 RepID=A0ABU2NID1_9PSEU|nr:hypothetical protein [Pseudonocardia sp. DSM 45834]MDT0353732.1 hypothetical protein [Pseudonocardia sp. DSM 45834]
MSDRDDLDRLLNERPSPEEIEAFLASIGDVLDEDERRADEELGDELRTQGLHAHEVTMAALTRAADIKALRAAKAEPHMHTGKDGVARFHERKPYKGFGLTTRVLLEWLADDLRAGVELMGGDAA